MLNVEIINNINITITRTKKITNLGEITDFDRYDEH